MILSSVLLTRFNRSENHIHVVNLVTRVLECKQSIALFIAVSDSTFATSTLIMKMFTFSLIMIDLIASTTVYRPFLSLLSSQLLHLEIHFQIRRHQRCSPSSSFNFKALFS